MLTPGSKGPRANEILIRPGSDDGAISATQRPKNAHEVELFERRLGRADVLEFARLTHHRFVVGKHHREICDALMAVERGEIDRLMIFAPPRHGKSELVSLRFPAWFLGHNPHKQIITISYADELALDFGRKVRNLVASEDYKRFFRGIELAADSQSAGRFHTNFGGVYLATGIFGSYVGKGADLFIIDDPFKSREEVESQKHRDKVWEAYRSEVQSRLMPGGRIILMHQRWHDDDMAARLLNESKKDGDKWHVISLPAIINEHTDNEQAQWPEWFTLDEMRRRRRNTDARTWNALYQQNPQPETGTYFQRDWFQRFKFGDEPENLNIYITSDFATIEGDGDWTEHGVFGIDADDNIWVLSWWFGQTASDVWIDKLLDLVLRYQPLCWFGEAGVIRRAVEPSFIRRMRERNVFCRREYISSIHDKHIRLRAFQARASMKKVYIPQVSWGERLLSQLVKFPGGPDDAADTCGLLGRAIDQAHSAIVRTKTEKRKTDRWGEFSALEEAEHLGWKVV